MCLLLGGTALTATAQNNDRELQKRDSLNQESRFNALDYLFQPRYRYSEEPWEKNSFWDHTYLQVGTGAFQFDSKGSPSLDFLQAMNVTIGHDFSAFHSARIGAGYNFSRAAKGGLDNMKIFDVHADWLFNLSNYTAGYKKARYVDVQTIAGLGVERINLGGKTATALEARLGTDVRFRLGTRNYLSLEPMVTIMQNKDLYPGSADFLLNYGLNLNWGYYIHPDAVIAHPKAGAEDLNPVFFELGAGAVFRSGNDLRTFKTTGPVYAFNVGKWMSPVWGARFGLQIGAPIRDYFMERGDVRNHAVTYLAGNAELLFNPFGLKDTYNADQKYGAFLFGGMTYGTNIPDHSKNIAFRGYTAGLDLWKRIDKNAELFVEPRVTRVMYAQNQILPNENLYSLMAGVRMKTYPYMERLQRATENFDARYWFLQLGYGFGFNTQESWVNGTTRQNWRGNWDLGLGYRYSNLSALRLVAGQNFNMYTDNDYRETSLSLQYMANLNTMLNRYSSEDRLNTWLFAGPYVADKNIPSGAQWRMGATAGVNFDYALNNTTSLFVEPGVRYQFKDNDWSINYKLGVAYRFDNGTNYDTFWNTDAYFEVGAGVEHLTQEGLDYGWGPQIQLGFGKWYDRVLGSRFTGRAAVVNSDHRAVNTVGLNADVMLDPISLLNSNYERRTAKAGLSLFFGGNFGVVNERGHSQDYENHMFAGFSQGAQLWTRINPNTRLFAEGRYGLNRTGIWNQNNILRPLDITLGLAFDYDETGGRASHVGRPGQADPTLEETLLRYKSLLEHKYWFIQADFGGNVNQTRQWMNGNSKQNWRGEWGTALGYRWSNLSAARLALGQNFTAGREDWREITIGANYMLNINALMNHADGDDRWNLWAMAGPYAAAYHENGDEFWYGGVSAGFQLGYQLNKTTSIYVQPEVRKRLGGSKDFSMLAKAGVSYRFDNGAYYDTFWNENSFFEFGVGAQQVLGAEDEQEWGPRVEFGFGKWFDRVLGIKAIAGLSGNNGSFQHTRTTGITTDLMIDPISLVSSNYDRTTASAGINFLLGGEFGLQHEYRKPYNHGYTHLISGFNEGAQVWVRTSPTSKVYVQGRYAQIHAGNWTTGRFYKPLTFTVGASFDYNAKFMREAVREEKDREIFVEVGAGLAERFNGEWNDMPSHLLLGGAIGLQTNTLHGARLSGDFFSKDGNQEINIAAAYQMNLLRLLQGADSSKTFGLYAFAGPMVNLSKYAEESTTSLGAQIGASLRVNLFGGTYLHFTPSFNYYSQDGSPRTWLRGLGGIGVRF